MINYEKEELTHMQTKTVDYRSRVITTEDKESAFNSLVELLQGNHKIIGHLRSIHRHNTSVNEGNEVQVYDFPVYEWRFQVAGNCDVGSALIALSHQE